MLIFRIPFHWEWSQNLVCSQCSSLTFYSIADCTESCTEGWSPGLVQQMSHCRQWTPKQFQMRQPASRSNIEAQPKLLACMLSIAASLRLQTEVPQAWLMSIEASLIVKGYIYVNSLTDMRVGARMKCVAPTKAKQMRIWQVKGSPLSRS